MQTQTCKKDRLINGMYCLPSLSYQNCLWLQQKKMLKMWRQQWAHNKPYAINIFSLISMHANQTCFGYLGQHVTKTGDPICVTLPKVAMANRDGIITEQNDTFVCPKVSVLFDLYDQNRAYFYNNLQYFLKCFYVLQ